MSLTFPFFPRRICWWENHRSPGAVWVNMSNGKKVLHLQVVEKEKRPITATATSGCKRFGRQRMASCLLDTFLHTCEPIRVGSRVGKSVHSEEVCYCYCFFCFSCWFILSLKKRARVVFSNGFWSGYRTKKLMRCAVALTLTGIVCLLFSLIICWHIARFCYLRLIT